MSILDSILTGTLSRPGLTLLSTTTVLLLARCIYRVSFHPISHIPGPVLPKLTSLWLHYHAYIGDEATVIHAAHIKYGPFVRVSPNEVDISDVDAVAPIYVTKGGFRKAPCYANFDIDGHKTLFSTTDVEYRTPRAKAVVPLFSTKSIKENEVALCGCVDRVIERMEEESKTGRPVDVLNLARGLAVDAVSVHLFQDNYNGTSEKGNKLSVSGFVDAFVGVGRFFYLPTIVFIWLDWAIAKFATDEHTNTSMEVVDKFVSNLVDATPSGSQNYPGRLSKLQLQRSEVEAQCKDLIFAGTDSTGMNFATICRQLALNPDKYEKLCAEVAANTKSRQIQEVQSLPYLSAVVREALRISMANPTRLPHIVPSSGWTFKSVYFAPGTIVGCSAYELHFNPLVFPNPTSFEPERWLDGSVNESMRDSFFAFGAGPRSCIARNLAMVELILGTEGLARSGVLKKARAVEDKVEILEWFNSRVKGEKIELIWE